MPFIQLVKKDLRMMKSVSLIALAILVIGVTVGTMFDSYGFGMMIIIDIFILFPTVYIMMSLSKDWKSRLFLILPQSGKKLIAAKLVAEMMTFWGLGLVVLAGFGWMNVLPGGISFFDLKMSTVEFLMFIPLGIAYSLSGGLLGAVAFFATRLADHALRSWSGLIGCLTAIVVIYLLTGFYTTDVYSSVFHSSLFPSLSLDGVTSSQKEEFTVRIGTDGVLYTGDLFYFGLLLCIMFFASSWMLDKKVEV